MSVNRIEVDVETLRQHAKEVTKFVIGINHVCSELQTALSRFENSIDPNDARVVHDSVTQTRNSLQGAIPELEMMQKRILAYANYVEEVKKSLNT